MPPKPTLEGAGLTRLLRQRPLQRATYPVDVFTLVEGQVEDATLTKRRGGDATHVDVGLGHGTEDVDAESVSVGAFDA